MHFQPHALPPALSPYLESIFHYKGFQPDHSIERVVPTGHVFIIFELDGMLRHTYDNESLQPIAGFSKVWVSGMHRSYLSISAHPDSEMFVLQFKPGGAHPFFHLPLDSLSEKVTPGDQLFNGELLTLHEQLLQPGPSTQKFQAAENWLAQRFDPKQSTPQELQAIIEQLQKASASEYASIVEAYPFSGKHLIEQFKKYVGLTPKYFQRILRFNEILQQVQQKEKLAWSQIAYQCGYADQSHFIKEFRHFSGFNPEEFIRLDFDKDEPNFFPLDRQG